MEMMLKKCTVGEANQEAQHSVLGKKKQKRMQNCILKNLQSN